MGFRIHQSLAQASLKRIVCRRLWMLVITGTITTGIRILVDGVVWLWMLHCRVRAWPHHPPGWSGPLPTSASGKVLPDLWTIACSPGSAKCCPQGVRFVIWTRRIWHTGMDGRPISISSLEIHRWLGVALLRRSANNWRSSRVILDITLIGASTEDGADLSWTLRSRGRRCKRAARVGLTGLPAARVF